MIFISYKGEEGTPFAKAIAGRLESWGGKCFYFERDCKTPENANKNWWEEVVAPFIREKTTSAVLILTDGILKKNPENELDEIFDEISYLKQHNELVYTKRLAVMIANQSISRESLKIDAPAWVDKLKNKMQFVYIRYGIDNAIDEICARVAAWEGLKPYLETCPYITIDGGELKKFNGGINILKLPPMFSEIGNAAFYGNLEIEELYLDNTNIKVIGQSAFGGCKNLTMIKIPASLERVKRYAFRDAACAITQNGMTIVDGKILTDCIASGEVVLPDSVTCIADYAFEFNYDVTAVRGKNVKFLGEGAFSGCRNLKQLDFPLATVDTKCESASPKKQAN